MSTTEVGMSTQADSHEPANAEQAPGLARRREASIVPADSIAGRALVAVIAIMSFLAALTLGAVILIRDAAAEWQSTVAREVTIQIRPIEGRNIDTEVAKAVEIARGEAGIASVRSYDKDESTRLLEPWLGSGLSLSDLPVPRIIAIKLASTGPPDLGALRKALSERVAGASLDDHRGWVDRMRAMTATALSIGVGILLLVVAATVLSVMFATRGAMSTNRPIVEVLHYVGAKDSFIAGEFQRHFLLLGLEGGLIGGGASILLFLLGQWAGEWFKGTAGEGQAAALFGSFTLGPEGYGAIVGLIVLIAAVTAFTSRATVRHTLRSMD